MIPILDTLKEYIKALPAACEAFYGECKMALARLQDPKKALSFLATSLSK